MERSTQTCIHSSSSHHIQSMESAMRAYEWLSMDELTTKRLDPVIGNRVAFDRAKPKALCPFVTQTRPLEPFSLSRVINQNISCLSFLNDIIIFFHGASILWTDRSESIWDEILIRAVCDGEYMQHIIHNGRSWVHLGSCFSLIRLISCYIFRYKVYISKQEGVRHYISQHLHTPVCLCQINRCLDNDWNYTYSQL